MQAKRFFAAMLTVCLLMLTLPAPAQAAMPYYITVDITNQIVTVYENSNRTNSGIVRQMICSTGASGHSTPRGTFTLPKKTYTKERQEWYYFPAYGCYAKWGTRIKGGILFHSILYNKNKVGPTAASRNALGRKASHGCVRLRVADAKWIALNCMAGTQCRIYNSGKTNKALRSRLLKKSFVRSEQSYNAFNGIVESSIPLSKGSQGTLVRKLQTRLKELGLYSGTVDGKFGTSTHNAVCAYEAGVGQSKTGKVTQALWDAIFSNNIPAGLAVTLSKGMSGPSVSALEQALTTLKMYSGAIDGVFGDGVQKGVSSFQRCAGQSATGKATVALQKAILNKAAEVKQKFGDQDYELTSYTRSIARAKVKVRRAYMYRKTSTRSRKVKRLARKKVVQVLSRGKTWSRVKYGSTTAYMRNRHLSFYTVKQTSYDYRAVEPEVNDDQPLTALAAPGEVPEEQLSDPQEEEPAAEEQPGEEPEQPGEEPEQPEEEPEQSGEPEAEPQPEEGGEQTAEAEPSEEPQSAEEPVEAPAQPEDPAPQTDAEEGNAPEEGDAPDEEEAGLLPAEPMDVDPEVVPDAQTGAVGLTLAGEAEDILEEGAENIALGAEWIEENPEEGEPEAELPLEIEVLETGE